MFGHPEIIIGMPTGSLTVEAINMCYLLQMSMMTVDFTKTAILSVTLDVVQLCQNYYQVVSLKLLVLFRW